MASYFAQSAAAPLARRAMSILLLASLVVAGSASQDITNIPGILSDTVKAATTLPTVSDFEKSYQQFAELLAPVMLLSNGMNFERADQVIADVFTSIANELAGLVEVAVGIQEPQVSINPFVLFNNGATNVSTNFAAAQAAAIGINYNPCLISVSARGADATAAGVNVQPNVIEILAEGASAWPMGVNIQPALIYINPWGTNVSPEGVSITPALIAIAPTAEAVGDVGVNVNPIGIAVTPGGGRRHL